MNKRLRTLVVACGSKAVPRICDLFGEWSEVNAVPCSEAREARAGADILVLSGGPQFYQDDDSLRQDYLDQFSFLDDEVRPVFGICMGHQGIGLRHGARLFTGRERRCDDEAIRFTEGAERHPLLAGVNDGSMFKERHTEGITPPDGFRVLGYSRWYPVEIMASEDGQYFGTQFHPELGGKEGFRLLRNFFDLASAYHEARVR